MSDAVLARVSQGRPNALFAPGEQAALDAFLSRVSHDLPRQLASDGEWASDEAFKARFEAALADPNWQSHFQLLFDRAEEPFYRGQASVREFDTALDDAGSRNSTLLQFQRGVIRSNLYPRLLAIHWASKNAIHQICAYYRLLNEIANNGDPHSARYATARQVLAFIAKYMREAPGSFRVALHEVAEELHDHFPTDRALQAAYGRLFVEDHPGLVSFMSDPKVSDAIEQTAERLEGVASWSNAQTEKATEELRRGLDGAGDGRAPQSIEPSTGKNGSVTGYGYPPNTWTLTFDDGPLGKYSDQILANLVAHDMHATFFQLAGMASSDPERSKKIFGTPGMEVGCHSWTHPQIPKLSDAGVNHEIDDAAARLAKIQGSHPLLFRLPYGAGFGDPRIRKVIAASKMIDVFWSVDSLDWQDHNPQSILARVNKQMSISKDNRGIILFHDIHPQSVEASKMLMDELEPKVKDGKVRIKTVGEVLDELNKGG